MDYDQTGLAAVYDRTRDHGPEHLALWMRRVSAHLGTRTPAVVLDLGCGTGRFAEALSSHFRTRVIGVDPSRTMLDQARRKRGRATVRYALGAAEAIPLPDRSVDLVFMSMVFHHFNAPSRAALECRRVLRDAGLAVLRAGTRDRIPDYPYVPFFPSSVPLLGSRLPARSAIRGVFESAGFETTATEIVVQQVAPTYAAYAQKVAARGSSILAALDAEAWDAGLSALRAHAARVDPRPVREAIDFFVFRARRPSAPARSPAP